MARGNTTKYKELYANQAYVACKEGGFSDVKLAKLFSVSKATIANWKNQFPEFLDSIKRGKDDYDSLNVENDLLKRARGFNYTEKHIEFIPGTEDIKAEKKITKLVVPDTTAQIFWLKNRQPHRWRDKQEIDQTINLSGSTRAFLEQVTDQNRKKAWEK